MESDRFRRGASDPGGWLLSFAFSRGLSIAPPAAFGRTATEFMMDLARRYVRQLYNRFEATLVPSARLGNLLAEWG